jgi:hypothetical protein
MKHKTFEQILRETINVDKLTSMQLTGILCAHSKYENRNDQLRKHSVMQAEGSDGVSGAAVASSAVGSQTSARGFWCIDHSEPKCEFQCGYCQENQPSA